MLSLSNSHTCGLDVDTRALLCIIRRTVCVDAIVFNCVLLSLSNGRTCGLDVNTREIQMKTLKVQ
jgi:hypothetical protein